MVLPAQEFASWHRKDPRVHLVIVGPVLDRAIAAELSATITALDKGTGGSE